MRLRVCDVFDAPGGVVYGVYQRLTRGLPELGNPIREGQVLAAGHPSPVLSLNMFLQSSESPQLLWPTGQSASVLFWARNEDIINKGHTSVPPVPY